MTLSIVAVGDLMLGENALSYRFGVQESIRRHGVAALFGRARAVLRGDIVLGNLELPITGPSGQRGIEADLFRAEPVVAEGLAAAGFTALSVANNHIMEHGPAGFESTVQILRSNGILPVGISGAAELVSLPGHSVALLACSLVDDRRGAVPYNRVSSPHAVLADVAAARRRADLVVVSIHWGQEYVTRPSPDQVAIGRAIVDAGADVVLGGHPHVVQGYEIYRGRPIVYSMGNFVFDMEFIRSTRTGLAARIVYDGDAWTIEPIPIASDAATHAPVPLDGAEREAVLAHCAAVRRTLEGRSVDRYRDRIREHDGDLRRMRGIAKREMYLHFMKNVHRYPPRLVLASLRHLVRGSMGAKT